ncbi:MAG: PGF-pre-PGF domain-containing protein [Haloarculaceae archaeon]
MRLRPLVVAVLVVGSVFGGAAVGGGLADSTGEPSVTVAVDSETVPDGGRHEVGSNPTLTVTAAVPPGAPADVELREIVVRVNGAHYRTLAVNGTAANRTVDLDLRNGDNEVRVIVTDEADSVNATTITVYKDAVAPYVFLTQPYETKPWHRIPDGNVSGTNATLTAQVIEDSAVDEVTVEHRFGSHTDVQRLTSVDENFSVPLDLGYSGAANRTNRVWITIVDEFGNERTYRFGINASDGAPPAVDVEPLPDETTRNQLYFEGVIRDDVWVESASVTFRRVGGNESETESIARSRSYSTGVDRRTVPFNESFYPLYTGTYEIVVRATDVHGRTTNRTYTIERVAAAEANLTPEIAVDRDRTVVLDSETLFLSGVAHEGVTRRLVVETRDPATGETIDYQVVHSGSKSERVEFDREVAIRPDRTAVIVRAIDPDGNETSRTFYVNGSAKDAFVGERTDETDRWPRVTVTPLRDGRPGTASASVTVRRAPADATVQVPPAGGRTAVAGTENATLDGMVLSTAAALNLTSTVVVRERTGGGLSAPPDARPAVTLTVGHSLSSGQLAGVSFDLRVNRSYLDAHGIDPENLTLYRLSGGEWTRLDTRRVDGGDGAVRYRVESPGLSSFSLAAPLPDPANATGNETSGNGTVGNETAGNGTAGNGTVGNGTVGNETVGNGTVGNGTLGNGTVGNGTVGNGTIGNGTTGNGTAGNETSGEARIIVTNVTVNRTQVAVNESVTINATLVNRGNATGEYVAGFQTFQGLNRTFVAKRTVSIPPGENRTLRVEHAFATTGNHTVSVNGTQAGPVVVSKGGGGGLLSVFSVLSFLPIRTIGLALGGIVGLLVVLVLVRFVLRRVGGEGAGG